MAECRYSIADTKDEHMNKGSKTVTVSGAIEKTAGGSDRAITATKTATMTMLFDMLLELGGR